MPAEVLTFKELQEKNKKEAEELESKEKAKEAALLNPNPAEPTEPEPKEDKAKEGLEFVDDDKGKADEPEFDAEGSPIEKTATPEPDEDWLKTDEEGPETVDGVPVKTHVKVKQKLKGTIGEQASKIQELEQKIEDLKKGVKPKEDISLPKKPVRDDFDDDDAYEKALIDYEDKATAARFDRIEKKRTEEARRRKNLEAINNAVDSHFARADALIKAHSISEEVYQKADRDVREGIESIMPGKGEGLTNYLISQIGEGSEKVFYYLGRNPKALNNLKGLLAEDPSGIKAAIYLGQEKQRLTNPARITSRGKPPPRQQQEGAIPGNLEGGTQSEQKLRAAYLLAHKENRLQDAWDAKKAAKKQGIDVSSWV